MSASPPGISGTAGEATADGRDTRWNDHRLQRRDLILAASLTCIERDGVGVGVAAIADEAGLPRSVVYRLFRDREDLDEQIRTRIIEEMMLDLAPALDPRGTAYDAVGHAVRTYVAWVDRRPRLHQFLGTGSATKPKTGSRVVTGTRTAVALAVVDLVQDFLGRRSTHPVPDGAAENLAFAMVGLVDGAVNRWVAHPESRSSADELTTFLTDALWGVITSTASRFGLRVDRRTRLSPTRNA